MKTNIINILVVDDNLDFIQRIQKILSNHDYTLQHISDGTDAQDFLLNTDNKPDIILLGCILPGISGIDLLTEIVAQRDELSIIFLQPDSNIETVVEAMKAGALDFIMKTSDLEDELATKIHKIYKIHKTKNENNRIEKEYWRIETENRKLSTVVEQSSATVVITDVEGIIEYVNPQFSLISGYSREEAIGQNPRILKSNILPHEYYSNLWQTIKSGRTWKGEFCNINKNGEQYWEEAIITPIVNDKNEIIRFAAIKHNITARKIAEDKVLQQNTELAKLNEDKNIFISILAHDLKNPFGGFMGLIEFMKNNFQKMSAEKLGDYFNIIFDSTQNTYQLLIDLLNWARTESGKMPFSPQLFSVIELVEQTNKLFQIQMLKKDICFTSSVSDDLFMYADLDLVKTVLRNFVSNAFKFTGHGGTITVDAVEINDEIHISVADSGIGMSEKTMSNLFKISKTSSSLGTDNEEGSGFGLILCKQFVELHRGHINVSSSLGKGSVFTLIIPQK